MSKKKYTPEAVKLIPKTQGHKDYVRAMSENDIIFCTGPAGSSKSFMSIGLACQYILEGTIDKIIIARPTVESSPKGLGHLPGNVDEKLYPYLIPAIEHLKMFLGHDTYCRLLRDKCIIFEALEYLRGRTFDNAFVIIEECQNCTASQIFMLITRVGFNTKMVINGDTKQNDLTGTRSDLQYMIDKLSSSNIKGVACHKMTVDDIVRSKIVKDIIMLLGDDVL